MNLANGNGLVFNIGDRIEGFSNPLWVLLLSAFRICQIDIVIASKIIGLLSAILTLVFVRFTCSNFLRLTFPLSLVLLCYLATNRSFVYYSISGMETSFYMLCVMAMNYFLLNEKHLLASLVCGVLALTRPEGILYLLPLCIGVLLSTRELFATMRACAIPIGLYASFTCFRLIYYGTLLPNTYMAKMGDFVLSPSVLLSHLHIFIPYTGYALGVGTYYLFFTLLGAVALASKKLSPLHFSVGISVLFTWFSNGDWMSFGRFYLPVLPIIVLFTFVALHILTLTAANALQRNSLLAIAILILAYNVFDTAKAVEHLNRGDDYNPAMHARNHVSIGKYLASNSSPSDVVVVNEIGAIGFFSGLKVVDMQGLTDRAIPPLLWNNRLEAYADYIMGHDPTFILLNNKQKPSDTTFQPMQAAIFRRMMGSGFYRAGPVFHLNSYKDLMMFIRIPVDRKGGDRDSDSK